MKPKLTCLIPLYGSEKFRSIVLKNIHEHLNSGMHVIVSDRHFKDNLIDEIEAQFHDNPSVLTLKAIDEADWVENINSMIQIVKTDYFRILPHDDSASGDSSKLLVDALERDESAILATGIVHAKNLLGLRITKRDQLNTEEINSTNDWSTESCLEFFWKGRFAGAFKGVVRTEPIKRHNLLIEKTPTLVHSERTWLFALALLGKYLVVPQSKLIKRYYSTSTHKQWKYSEQTTLDATNVMAGYCDRLIEDKDLSRRVKFNLFYNALRTRRRQPNSITYSNLLPTH